MSKKLKNKGIVPSAMSGKVFTSLKDLGSAMGFHPPDPQPAKSMTCRKCGAVMRNIPGTNVWLCDAVVEQEKDGVKKQAVCGNRAMTSARPAPQSSEKSVGFKPRQKQQDKPAGKSAKNTTV